MIRRRRSTRPPSQIQRALRRSRWRTALEWLRPRWLSILGALGCFSGTLGLFISPSFRVEQVTIRRDTGSAGEEVTRATRLAQVIGQNIFLVNTQRVAQEVAQVPSVRYARVTPRFPGGVEVEIVERAPIALWQTLHGGFLVDDQGYVLAEAGESAPPSMMTVRDTTGRELRLGDQVSQRALLAARELVQAMPAAGIKVREVELGAQGLVFVTEAGWKVIFGETDALNAKLANLAVMTEQAQKQNLRIAVFDLRPKDRPFYQLQQ